MFRSLSSRILTRLVASRSGAPPPIEPNNNPDQPLGRWSICYDENQLQNRIRWANEDHCGTCSQDEPTSQPTSQPTPTPTKTSESGLPSTPMSQQSAPPMAKATKQPVINNLRRRVTTPDKPNINASWL